MARYPWSGQAVAVGVCLVALAISACSSRSALSLRPVTAGPTSCVTRGTAHAVPVRPAACSRARRPAVSAPRLTPPRESRSPRSADRSGPLAAAEFAPGACVAFNPVRASGGRTVFIDAGHGGPDPGAVGTTASGRTVEEKDVTLDVALIAARILRGHGYRVVLSRTTDNAVARLTSADLAGRELSIRGAHAALLARVRCANLAQASALVSVHINAFSDSASAGATTVYDAERSFGSRNKVFAELLQRHMISALAGAGWRVRDRGVSTDAYAGGAHDARAAQYGHLLVLGHAAPGYLDHPTTMPGALVEPLFISNPAEASIAASTAGQTAIAAGITSAAEQLIRGGG